MEDEGEVKPLKDRTEYYAKQDIDELEDALEAIEVLLKATEHIDSEMYSEKVLIDGAKSKVREAKMHLTRPLMWANGEKIMEEED